MGPSVKADARVRQPHLDAGAALPGGLVGVVAAPREAAVLGQDVGLAPGHGDVGGAFGQQTVSYMPARFELVLA